MQRFSTQSDNLEQMATAATDAPGGILAEIMQIADHVARKVYDSVSHDRLSQLGLVEIAQLLNGPEAMLKVVWFAQWQGYGSDTFQYLVPAAYAAHHLDAIPRRMQHRLQREVFRIDTTLAL